MINRICSIAEQPVQPPTVDNVITECPCAQGEQAKEAPIVNRHVKRYPGQTIAIDVFFPDLTDAQSRPALVIVWGRQSSTWPDGYRILGELARGVVAARGRRILKVPTSWTRMIPTGPLDNQASGELSSSPSDSSEVNVPRAAGPRVDRTVVDVSAAPLDSIAPRASRATGRHADRTSGELSPPPLDSTAETVPRASGPRVDRAMGELSAASLDFISPRESRATGRHTDRTAGELFPPHR